MLVTRERKWRSRTAQLERRLATTRRHAAERDELASVGQFVSGLAHELRSPLQGVLGNTEVMLASAGRDQTTAEELEQIRESATRAAGIIRNLIAFADTTALVRRWQDLNDIVHRAVEARRPLLEPSGVRLDVEPAERLPLVYVDGRQLERVIAAFFGPDLAARGASTSVTVATRRDGERLTVDIEEVGPPGGEHDQRAWSDDLPACRRVLEAHGGALRVEPGPWGVRIRIELPIAAGAPAAAVS